MIADVVQFVVDGLHKLPPEKQQMVAFYVRDLVEEATPADQAPQPVEGVTPDTLWDTIDELVASIPEEELARVPVDGAEQHDHYLYGSPKR